MWISSKDRLINADLLRGIAICESTDIEVFGYSNLKPFVLYGRCAGTEKTVIIDSFDTYGEAELELIRLFRRLTI